MKIAVEVERLECDVHWRVRVFVDGDLIEEDYKTDERTAAVEAVEAITAWIEQELINDVADGGEAKAPEGGEAP